MTGVIAKHLKSNIIGKTMSNLQQKVEASIALWATFKTTFTAYEVYATMSADYHEADVRPVVHQYMRQNMHRLGYEVTFLRVLSDGRSARVYHHYSVDPEQYGPALEWAQAQGLNTPSNPVTPPATPNWRQVRQQRRATQKWTPGTPREMGKEPRLRVPMKALESADLDKFPYITVVLDGSGTTVVIRPADPNTDRVYKLDKDRSLRFSPKKFGLAATAFDITSDNGTLRITPTN